MTIEELIVHLQSFDQRLKVGGRDSCGGFLEMDKCNFDTAFSDEGDILEITPPETLDWAPYV